MNVNITDDDKFLLVQNLSEYELNNLISFFTKEPENSWVIKKKNSYIDTSNCFVNKFGMLPIGLWSELLKFSQKYNVSMNFNERINNVIQDNQLDFSIFKYYVDNLFENAHNDKGEEVAPMGYQLEGVFKLLRFKKCCVEVTTSGGKTLMAYILFKFLHDVKHTKKCLYIVPSTSLATQSFDKFNVYEKWVNGKYDYKPAYLIGQMNKKAKKQLEGADTIFATYQSLKNKDAEWFKDFDLVIVDECLHPDTKIKMGDGTEKPISEVKVGEDVVTYNEETKKEEIHPVKKVYKNLSEHKELFEIEMEDGTVLNITGNHKVLTKDRGWVRVDNLTCDDEIIELGANG